MAMMTASAMQYRRTHVNSLGMRGQVARWSRTSGYPGDDEEGPGLFCQSLLACLGMAFLGSGIYLWFSSWIDTRGEKVAEFNNVASNWTERYRPSFLSSNMSISINGSKFYPMDVDNSSDIVGQARIEMSKPDVLKWEMLRFRVNYIIPDDFFIGANQHDPYQPLPGGGPVRFIIKARDKGGGVVFDEELRLREWEPVGGNQKMCHVQGKGIWGNGQCWQLQTLRSICVRVKQEADGGLPIGNNPVGDGWIPAGTGGNPKLSGCLHLNPTHYVKYNDLYTAHQKATSSFVSTIGSRGDALITSTPAPSNQTGIHAVPISISVRHHLDPYLVAFAFSDSKFTFGHTMHHNFVESLVLMAIGSAILAPLLCMVIYSASDKVAVEAEKRRQRRQYSRQLQHESFDGDVASHSDHDSPLDAQRSTYSSTRRRGGSRDRQGRGNVEGNEAGIEMAEGVHLAPADVSLSIDS